MHSAVICTSGGGSEQFSPGLTISKKIWNFQKIPRDHRNHRENRWNIEEMSRISRKYRENRWNIEEISRKSMNYRWNIEKISIKHRENRWNIDEISRKSMKYRWNLIYFRIVRKFSRKFPHYFLEPHSKISILQWFALPEVAPSNFLQA